MTNITLRASGILAVLLAVVACAGSDYGSVAPDAGGGGGGGGPRGLVQVGSGVQYVSRHNGSDNPAVDTVAVGDTVTWRWAGSMSHAVRWIDAPGHADSPLHAGSGTFTTTFDVPGTYHYDCSVHGRAMTGTIVVTGPPTTSVVDPVGDTFGSAGHQWDLTAFTITHDSVGIVVRLDFSEPVRPPTFGDQSSIVGLVEFDLDQNAATGRPAGSDLLRVDGGSAGLGVDGGIALGPYDADTAVVVFDANGRETLRVKPQFAGNRITLRVPLTALGRDDGLLNAVVAIGNGFGVTDIAPQSGHLTVGR